MDFILTWLVENQTLLILIVVALAVLVFLQKILGGVRRGLRRLRGPKELHPKLRQYGGRSDAELAKDQLDAAGVIATSSTNRIAGYVVVRQIEAVYVEGYRAGDEALAAIKAAAARKGANAVINLHQQRSDAGRCSAQGDAVTIRPVTG